MVFAGARYGLVLFAGGIIAEIAVVQSSLSWPFVLGVCAIIAASYSTAAFVARGYLRLDVALMHVRDIVVLLVSGSAGALLAGFLLSALLVADAELDWNDVLVAAGPLLVGDVIGIAVVTPLTLRFVFRRSDWQIAPLRTLAPDLVLCGALLAAALAVIVGSEPATGFKFFYLLFLPVVIAAVRYGLDGACISLAVTQFGLVGVLLRQGYDAHAFTEFQTMMFVLTITGLIVGVVVSERQNADRRAREAEALVKAKEAEAARAARFSLVSGMASALAHEISQPMTAARALARSAEHLLQAAVPDLVRAKGNLSTLVAQIDHASDVVRRMRDFLRRGPHVGTVDLAAMLDDAVALIRTDIAAHGVHIELQMEDGLPAVHGDRVQLEQVVVNLVRNAVEALAEARRVDGQVRIHAARLAAPDRVEIGVADNGPGIAPELAERLFEPLTTSKDDGLGLGLPICAAIIESHGGHIWVHSGANGSTEFRFSLPLNPTRTT
jgi:signal transduction histidine kinase